MADLPNSDFSQTDSTAHSMCPLLYSCNITKLTGLIKKKPAKLSASQNHEEELFALLKQTYIYLSDLTYKPLFLSSAACCSL